MSTTSVIAGGLIEEEGLNSDKLRIFAREFWLFGVKQAQACVFGAFLLGLILLTKVWFPLEGWMYRNDFLFLAALSFQAALLLFKLETYREASVIFMFHVVATGLELFKTSDAVGSWSYPGEFVFGIGNVPLFAGFMYSAVGSYIARVWRIFDFRFSDYPKFSWSVVLVVLVYANFFTHHYTVDIRLPLLGGMFGLFGPTWVHFKCDKKHRKMPLTVGWFLVALFIWFAENIATFSSIWLYPAQQGAWSIVSPTKLLAWNLLMLLSFVLVTLVHRPRHLAAQVNDSIARQERSSARSPSRPSTPNVERPSGIHLVQPQWPSRVSSQ